MQHSINLTVLQSNSQNHNKTSNQKQNASSKLPQTPSFVNIINSIHPKPKRVTAHLQNLHKTYTKHKIHQQTPKKYHQNYINPLQNRSNKRVFIIEKPQSSTQNNLLFVPYQKENFQLQKPAILIQTPKENRNLTLFFTKKRFYLNKKNQRQKETSFMIKKSTSFVRRDLNLSLNNFTEEKVQVLVKRRNQEKEELYYVDELKKQLKKMEQFIGELSEEIPIKVGHFFQTVSTFFKYKDIRIPEQCKVSVYLGRQKKKTTLIFDMDQTLIHAQPYKKDIHEKSWGQNVQIVLEDGSKIMINLKVRPFVMEVLHRLKKKYQIGVFTAANETYAKQILRKLDVKGEIFDFQLYRQHCDVFERKLAVKDLRILSNRGIKNIVLVDNSPQTYLYQKENAVPIVSFYDDQRDCEMLKLEEFIERNELDKREDVRQILQKCFKFRKYTEFDCLQEILQDLY